MSRGSMASQKHPVRHWVIPDAGLEPSFWFHRALFMVIVWWQPYFSSKTRHHSRMVSPLVIPHPIFFSPPPGSHLGGAAQADWPGWISAPRCSDMRQTAGRCHSGSRGSNLPGRWLWWEMTGTLVVEFRDKGWSIREGFTKCVNVRNLYPTPLPVPTSFLFCCLKDVSSHFLMQANVKAYRQDSSHGAPPSNSLANERKSG